jgi:predicted DCC family thiol-disulfide oxidoreductase YuxK
MTAEERGESDVAESDGADSGASVDTTSGHPKRTVILYDSDCGFCRWSADRILAWDREKRLRPVALQDPEAAELLAKMDEDARMESWHLVTPDGRVHSGGAAVAPLAKLLPAGAPVAGLASAFPGFTQRLYGLVARHRGRLGRLLGEQACAVDPRSRPSPADGR